MHTIPVHQIRKQGSENPILKNNSSTPGRGENKSKNTASKQPDDYNTTMPTTKEGDYYSKPQERQKPLSKQPNMHTQRASTVHLMSEIS